MKLKATILIGLILLSSISCSDSDDNTSTDSSTDTSGSVRFKVTFNARWTAADFPTQYPGNAHFSPLVGTVHNNQVVFWQRDGQAATPGIESMAESGSTSAFSDEIEIAKDNGLSLGVIQGPGIGSGSGQAIVEFDTQADYPLLTLVTMVAPSPDWFVGIAGLALRSASGQWIERQEWELKVYDAGTDTGVSFASDNADSSAESLPITLLSTERADTDFSDGVHFESMKRVGTFVIERVVQ